MEVVAFVGHMDIVRCCCYSPDGSKIVSCSDDTCVKVPCCCLVILSSVLNRPPET